MCLSDIRRPPAEWRGIAHGHNATGACRAPEPLLACYEVLAWEHGEAECPMNKNG